MRLRSRGLAIALGALLIGSLPAAAQGESSAVAFDGIGFAFDDELGTSVNINAVPPAPFGPDAPRLFDGPGHLAFTVYGPRPEAAKVPRASDAPGVVRFYSVSDLADYEWQFRQFMTLAALLDERPDLTVYTAVDEVEGIRTLPFVHDGSAGQAIHARAHYIDTPELAGVAYLTVFRQDVYPFAAGDFWYTFQGLSHDGQQYVAADFAVKAGMFPAKVSRKQVKQTASFKKWLAYQERSRQDLEAAASTAFTPPLRSIDALVESISFDDEPTPDGDR